MTDAPIVLEKADAEELFRASQVLTDAKFEAEELVAQARLLVAQAQRGHRRVVSRLAQAYGFDPERGYVLEAGRLVIPAPQTSP